MLEHVYVKLTNGDDLLSYKISETPTSIFLMKPIVIRQTVTLSGTAKASAQPYCGLAKENVVEVFKTSCIFISTMRDEAKSYYDSLAEQNYTALDNVSREMKKSGSHPEDSNDSIENLKDTNKTKLH